MLKIGSHLSVSGGFYSMERDALAMGASTFQFFTRNPRGSRAKEWDSGDIEKFLRLKKENGFSQIVAHAAYTLNPCSADERVREFARITMADDIRRMELIGGNFYNFHPGSHVGQGSEKGIAFIGGLINELLYEEMTTTVLLETMAGKGSEIGRSFEELRTIIDSVCLKEKIGVCLDTCHVYDAGYDIVNNLGGVLDEFDRIIGLDRLFVIHLNDSMNPFESHKDRHQKIGLGAIGLRAFENIINEPRLKNKLFILETPNDLSGYAQEIKVLKGLYRDA